LENRLKAALLDILKWDDPQPVAMVSFADRAMIAIRERHPDMPARVREYMEDLVAKIPLIPPTNAQDIPDEQLVQAINASTPLVVEFAGVVKLIAEMNAVEAAQTVYEGFADILSLTVPPTPQRRDETFSYDLAKFLGHELFVMFVALLMRNKRWELLATLLAEEFYVRTSDYGQSAFASFTALCQPVALLFHRNDRLGLRKKSLQGNLLYERHATGELANVVSAEQFMEADYFLFLRDLLKQATMPSQCIEWRAWSTVLMGKPASFFYKAVRGEAAEQLARALGLPDVPTLHSRLTERRDALTSMWTYGFNSPWFDPLERFDIDSIGSR
jgi:hypothetical protein